MSYKEGQKAAKAALNGSLTKVSFNPKRLDWATRMLNLGIKEFKREHKGKLKGSLIREYKQKAWAGVQ